MPHRYSHLTLADRRLIFQLLNAKVSVPLIAAKLDRHPSTIYREIRRNYLHDEDRRYRGYFATVAHDKAGQRRVRLGKLHRQPGLLAHVTERLALGWSPEQIAGHLKHQADLGVYACHETIYRYVYSRDGHRHELYRLLPSLRSRRRAGRKARGPRIPEANTIAKRPELIAGRQSFGHWECDLVAFKKEYGKANLTSLVERKSRYTYLMRNPDRGSAGVIGGIRSKLATLPPELRQTITFDQGTEFAAYPRLKSLGVDSYFCKPQAPWQKGTVENTNGRLRRYLPREVDIARLSSRELAAVERRLNHTPRKCLGYRTPHQALTEQLNTSRQLSDQTTRPSHFG